MGAWSTRRADDGVPATMQQQGTPGKWRGRRLAERLISDAHMACDQGEFDLAWTILALAETVMTRRGGTWELGRKRVMANIVTAYERLWWLRQPAQPSVLFPVESFQIIRDRLGGPDED